MEGGGERSWERGAGGAGVRILRARAPRPHAAAGSGAAKCSSASERKDDGDDAAPPDSFARVAAALRFPSAIDKSSTILR